MQAAEAPGSAATMRRARPSSCHLKAKHRAATATQRLAATPSARRPAAQLLMQRRTPLFSVWIRGRRPPELARDILTERKPRGKARYGHRSDLTTRKSAFPSSRPHTGNREQGRIGRVRSDHRICTRVRFHRVRSIVGPARHLRTKRYTHISFFSLEDKTQTW